MNKILEMKFGSHLYGTNTPESDLDYKAIYIPTAREIVLGNYHKTILTGRSKEHAERNTKDDVDTETFSLDRFLELLTDGQTVALDMLFAPDSFVKVNPKYFGVWQDIKYNRRELVSRKVNSFIGYARQQAAKYGIKGSRMDALKMTMETLESFPDQRVKLFEHESDISKLLEASKEFVSLEKEKLVDVVMIPGPNKVDLMPHLQVCGRKIPFGSTIKFAKDVFGKILQGYGERAKKAHLDGGVDWKALSHAVRVNSQGIELLKTGHITFPRPDRKLLTDIKLGKIPYPEVAEIIEKGLADLILENGLSQLRAEPNLDWVRDFVYDIYSEEVKRS